VQADVPVSVTADVDGIVESAVRAVIADEGEIGVQVAAVRGGSEIVHVVGGWTSPERTRPVAGDDLFTIFSATKGVVAAACLQLIDAGELELDAPLRSLWPELAAQGKEDLSLRHVLTHSAGIPQMPEQTTIEQMCDWDHMVKAVAALEPLWPPGTQVAYHAYTFGWLAGEVVRRCVGTADVADAARGLVCDTTTQDGFYLGVPADQEHRVVDLSAVPARGREDTELFRRSLPAHLDTGPEVYGRSDVRRAPLPGAGGLANAISMARIYDQIVHADPASWLRRGTMLWDERPDAVVGRAVPRGLGFWVSGSQVAPQEKPLHGGPGRFGHPGAGGSIAWGDHEAGVGIAILHNRLTPDGWRDRSIRRVVDAIYEALGHIERTSS
jgi:CubicO group peptidase (beta-lactamase class C family)